MTTVVEDGLRQARAGAPAAKAPNTVMTVASTDVAFQSLNGGFSGPVECLTAPKTCLPKHGDSPAPLSTMPSVDGYTEKFTAGPAPTAATNMRVGRLG